MNQNPQLADIKLALAVLSVQLDGLAARRSGPFQVPSDQSDPSDTKIDRSFALRAVLAMRRIDEKANDH
jgi:hypothetical protein